jgi:Cof subfamily protein (haloacid dehalogenase superfamily)
VTRYALVAIDVDGTLLTSHGEVSPRTRAALASAVDAGATIVLATGRRLRSARPIAAMLAHPPLLLCSQGATLWRDGTLLYHQHMSVRAAEAVVDAARTCDMQTVVFGHAATPATVDLLYVDGDWQANERLRWYLGRNVDCVRPYTPGCLADGPAQTFTLDATERLDRLHDALLRHPDAAHLYRVIYSSTQFRVGGAIEVLHPQASKAAALAFLCAELDIGPENVIAFGDNVNDVEMLAFAGLGVAMANGSAEARAVAGLVAPSNDEDGVAAVLEQHFR